ncbi:hypothetical protein DFR70_108150 [Nocardia tenerifensis]|uniref:Uncharacterized protein n=1 Tax=Nocardia tenerifensis TaxID=228006 RepID=A0A318KA67_9NOCA|nr:hypothetical protein DFR70_108150 [Nocardia tenerifensis]
MVGLCRRGRGSATTGDEVSRYLIGAVPMSMILYLLLLPFVGDEAARQLAIQFRLGPDN